MISIVIPTLNEEQNIYHLFKELKSEIKKRKIEAEIIVVDGHSSDKTVEIAKKFGAKLIYEDKGKGFALRKGMKIAKGDTIITMDADLSHKSSEIGLLIEGIKSGYDICMGSRFIQGGGTEDMTLIRKIGNKFFVFLVNLIYEMNYSDLCYGYRSFNRGCLKKLNLKSDGFGIETEIAVKAAKNKLKVLEIPSYEKLRNKGRGKLKAFSDGLIILKTIIKYAFSE